MSEKSTALAVVPQQAATPALMRPIARPAEFVEAHKEAAALIRDALEQGRDYGRIPGAGNKPALLKPGAERLALAFGCRADYEIVQGEVDHNRDNKYQDKSGRERTSFGLYRYVVRCVLTRHDGAEVGSGLATCSSLESKYISRPRDCENTVLKMAEKRALVAAVLGAFGLSDRFTQDIEDMENDEEPRARPAPQAAPPPPADRLPGALSWAWAHLARVEKAAHVDVDADDDTRKGAQEAVVMARAEDAKGCEALRAVDPRLFLAVRAHDDIAEAKVKDVTYEPNDEEREALMWLEAQRRKG